MSVRPAVLALGLLAVGAAAVAAASVSADGEIRSDAKVSVKAKVSVPIQRMAVEEGEAVRAGQLLVEMANEVQRAQVEAAKAEAARARSAVEEADLQQRSAARELERNLKVTDLITERELDQSRDAVKRAEADGRTRRDEVVKADAQLAVAEANLRDTMIIAPFDGVVSRIYLREGATPRAADTTLLDFLTLGRLYVEVALPLEYLRSVDRGMPVSIVVEDEHRSIRTPTVGKIRYVYPEIDSTTRMFRVKVDVERVDLKVLPGMLGRVSVTPAAPRR